MKRLIYGVVIAVVLAGTTLTVQTQFYSEWCNYATWDPFCWM
jgi:hypothetical protein